MRKIVVVPYENHWIEKFQMEAERLKSVPARNSGDSSYWQYISARTSG